MKVHGAAAMLFWVIFGALLPVHMHRAWMAQKNRFSGTGITAVCVGLGVTGYGLYYASGEALREFHHFAHLGLGVMSPAFIFWHIRAGRRAINSGSPSAR
jgi:hypothetical protein